MKKLKEWYFRNGVAILFTGVLFFSITHLLSYFYCEFVNTEVIQMIDMKKQIMKLDKVDNKMDEHGYLDMD